MKALPLWQPWASLVAVGAKRVETRGWPAPVWVVGERVAIHATKTEKNLWQASTEPFRNYLPATDRLPLGAVIATVVVVRCLTITEQLAAWMEREKPHEFAFGDYSLDPVRYAWVLRDARAFAPIAWKGSQGMFDVPDERIPGMTAQQAML